LGRRAEETGPEVSRPGTDKEEGSHRSRASVRLGQARGKLLLVSGTSNLSGSEKEKERRKEEDEELIFRRFSLGWSNEGRPR